MTYAMFNELITLSPHPVVLLEGTRKLPAGRKYNDVVRFAQWLADRYRLAVFRTGNATGSDDAFAKGVKKVDPSRLQYVLPYTGHRRNEIDSASYQMSIDDLDCSMTELVDRYTVAASPERSSMFRRTDAELPPKVRAQAQYLLRDTLKVIGNKTMGPATVGLFYVNEDDPMKGGTGHTIRVCRARAVPVAFQDEWLTWGEL
jgi:hypothetical protein